jgi:hypothetical protein
MPQCLLKLNLDPAVPLCFVYSSQEAWCVARIERLGEDDVKVTVSLQRGGGGPFTVRKSETKPWDPSHA